jgi:1-phosphofructokinase family hexose kinase
VIGVVCLNPALDITYHVPAVDWAGTNRPSAVYARPGGKGLNVARTLHSLGAEVLAMGFAGGVTGAEVTGALGELGVPAEFTPVGEQTRRTVTIVDGRGDVAAFNEHGPRVAAAEFADFRARYAKAVRSCTAIVLSGSLAPGLPADTYATLIEVAATAGVPAVLDTSGEALARGVAARPAIVKPNLDELQPLPGRPLVTGHGTDLRAVAAAADKLRTAGAQAVVVSLGADGLLAATVDGRWHAFPPGAVAGNATGAGDAVAAGLAHALVRGLPWDERLRHAVALGTAAAAAPAAGEFSTTDYTTGLAEVTVRKDEVR